MLGLIVRGVGFIAGYFAVDKVADNIETTNKNNNELAREGKNFTSHLVTIAKYGALTASFVTAVMAFKAWKK